ncbi:MAG: DUF2232 domain-containing protein [Candidatus Hydrogenedentota bacterium]
MGRYFPALLFTACTLIVFGPVGAVFGATATAIVVAGGKPVLGLPFVAAAMVAGWLAADAWYGLLLALMVAAPGGCIGWLVRRGNNFSIATFGGALVLAPLNVAQLPLARTAVMESRGLLVEAAAKDEAGERIDVMIAGFDWILEHWNDLAYGAAFSSSLFVCCVTATLVGAWLRRTGQLPPSLGSFRDFRPPEWLVWPLIAVAIGWFAYYWRWQDEWLRAVSLNAALGLMNVYLLNGFAIAVYAAAVLRPHAVVIAMVAVGMVFLNMWPMLMGFGLFDTWIEFRKKLDAAAARAAGTSDDARH